jgi:sulfide:quinone oxidoreductase
MFKATGVSTDILTSLASDIVKQKDFIKQYSQFAKSPAKLKAALRQKGYSEAGADALVSEIKKTLMKVVNRYGIKFKPSYAPVKIDAEKKVITFKSTVPKDSEFLINADASIGEKLIGDSFIEMPYDMLHIAPPQAPPLFIRESELVNEAGWLDVDIHTLQHKKYTNIFGLGDVAALPTAKTGAAIRKQVPVVVGNVFQLKETNTLNSKIYEGYSSCPLVTGYGKMVLAEFNYKNEFTPDPKLKQMLVFNSDKEHWRLWFLKKYILPYLYWNKMLKGKEV